MRLQIELGYHLASEEHRPNALVTNARVVLGPDPARHLAGIEEYARAGFDHVHVHQVGTDHDGFLRFYEREVLPHVDRVLAGAGR